MILIIKIININTAVFFCKIGILCVSFCFLLSCNKTQSSRNVLANATLDVKQDSEVKRKRLDDYNSLDVKVDATTISAESLERSSKTENEGIIEKDQVFSQFQLEECSEQSQDTIESFEISFSDQSDQYSQASSMRHIMFFTSKGKVNVYLNPSEKHVLTDVRFPFKCETNGNNGNWMSFLFDQDHNMFADVQLYKLQEFYIDFVIVDGEKLITVRENTSEEQQIKQNVNHFNFFLNRAALDCSSDNLPSVIISANNPLLHRFESKWIWDFGKIVHSSSVGHSIPHRAYYLYEQDHDNYINSEVPYGIKLKINNDHEIDIPSTHLRSIIINYPDVIYRIALNQQGRELLKQERINHNLTCD